MLCQQTSPKPWLTNVNMTSYRDVTNNSVYLVTMTTMSLRHCSIREFGRGHTIKQSPRASLDLCTPTDSNWLLTVYKLIAASRVQEVCRNDVLVCHWATLPFAHAVHYFAGTCRQSSSGCAAELYLTSGFCYIQNAVDTAIIKVRAR